MPAHELAQAEPMRVGRVIGLEPSGVEEYERLHREVWPGVVERLRASNIRNYSIFRFGTLLFSYYEYLGEDYESDLAAIGEDEVTKEWWTLCRPLQRPLTPAEAGGWWTTLPEVFRLD